MGDYRSKPCTNGRMQIQSYHGHRPPSSSPNDRRSHSASYSSSSYDLRQTHMGGVKDLKLKKGKSTSGPSWGFTDPEFERKKRVASYNAYSVEGKVKGSFRKSFKWIKDRYNQILLNGWLHSYRRQRREPELMQSEVVEEIIYGLESGILFGASPSCWFPHASQSVCAVVVRARLMN